MESSKEKMHPQRNPIFPKRIILIHHGLLQRVTISTYPIGRSFSMKKECRIREQDLGNFQEERLKVIKLRGKNMEASYIGFQVENRLLMFLIVYQKQKLERSPIQIRIISPVSILRKVQIM
ncbi:hypothetical protein CFP56_037628 [Quercus suber]|uniref:Uncharacterized protein n=1 Tax=Quercus suber TaxID=58331 RepID=A0AAW0J426_QUESU